MHVLEAVKTITDKGATFRSLTEQINTSDPTGRAMLAIMCAFARLERRAPAPD